MFWPDDMNTHLKENRRQFLPETMRNRQSTRIQLYVITSSEFQCGRQFDENFIVIEERQSKVQVLLRYIGGNFRLIKEKLEISAIDW